MMKRLAGIFLIISAATCILHAQNYNNPGGVIAACSGYFYDSGGPSRNYADGENIATTFCPTAAGKCLSITFTSFDLESTFDDLTIYDGASSAYPIIGTYSGTNSPGTVTATNGCLTFIFDSDFSISNPGWSANIACVSCPPPPPCTGTTPFCASTPPDICPNACHLGTLSAPPNCPFTGTATNVFCLSNTGATASTPYRYLTGCQPAGSNMAAPAADVWYTFVASSNIIDISISGLYNPNIGLYEGTDCNTFIGRGCAVGAFGNLQASFQPITRGQTYYLQISGGDTTEKGDFTLTITGRNDCDPCVINALLTASPLPSGGVYQAGTTVHFCLTVTRWNPTSSNWLHGIVPDFGQCWDMSTLVTYPPPTCDFNGSWKWYNSVTSSVTGTTAGPGFFYESILGCAGICDPNDPGDNYGDNCTGVVNFVFCWDITVARCTNGNNLNVSVNTFGDGETGSWTSFACAADPVFEFFATYTDCPEPLLQMKGASCNGAADGWVIAEGQGTAPFDFVWRDSLGNILKTSTAVNDFDTLSLLPGGDYTIEQSDAGQCVNTVSFVIGEPSALTENISVTHVSCSGAQDGGMDIAATGGVAPYEYSIDGINFQSSNIFSGLSPGSYSVSLRDDSNCVTTQSASIIEPAPLMIELDSIVNSSCSFSDDGAVYVSITGGTAPYTFIWSDASVTEDIANLAGGNYLLTVTDLNGCVATDSFFVMSSPGITLSAMVINAKCNGASDGSVNLTVNGGTGPFSYSWSNGAVAEDLTGVPAGTYAVNVLDMNQCPDSLTVIVLEPSALVLNGNATDLLCNGGSSGMIDITLAGGVLPYSFLWSNNAVTEDISGAAAGTYSVIATDSHSCTASMTFALTEPDSIVLTSVKTDVSCNAGNDGAIDLAASGGVFPYQFNWSNNAATEDITGLSANVYDVIVTDSNLCSASSSIAIAEPGALIANGIVTDVSCNGESTGAINLTVNGGVAPYGYQWSNTSDVEDLAGISAGNYMVTVLDANLCPDTLAFVVGQPSAIALDGIVANLLCNGDNSGTIDLTASGGVQPFSFLWSNNAITEDISGVAAGIYTVAAADSNLCSATASFSLSQPDSIVLTSVKTDVSCNGGNDGAIDLSVSGGIIPYRFNWSNNTYTEDLAGLTANTYDVIVMDSNLCIASASATISEPSVLAVSGIVTDVSCNGESTGAIDLAAVGGVGPYSYQWSNTAIVEDLNGIAAGNYMVTVLDANLCPDTLAFVVGQPSAIALDGIVANLLCNGDNSGTIDLTASGGVQPFSFLWSNNAITEDISGVASGTYSVIATDSNLCSGIKSFMLDEPDAIALSTATTDIACNGGNDGAIDLSVSGGVNPYQFNWSNNETTEDITGLSANVYDVVVIDSNLCTTALSVTITEPAALAVNGIITDVLCNGENTGDVDITVAGGATPYNFQWSNSAVSEDLSLVTAGSYSVIITDSNQCTVSSTFPVAEPPAIMLSGIITHVACNTANTGAVDLTVSGGVQPFSLLWSNNAVTEDISGVAAGIYSVTATDFNSCSATASFTLTQPDSIVLTLVKTDVNCAGGNDGAIDLTIISGTQPFRFTWSNNAATEDISGLAAGAYSVVVIDSNFCTASSSATINEPSPLVVNGNVIDVICNGDSSGEINLSVSGGTVPYAYRWTNAEVSEDLIGISAASYMVTVFDANQCSDTSAFAVAEPPAIVLSGITTNLLCFKDYSGAIDLTASGGVNPFAYSWSNNASTEDISGVAAGTFSVTTTDFNNCIATASFTLTQPDSVELTGALTHVSCAQGNDGAIYLTVNGGTAPFQFIWSNNASTEDITGLTAGNYDVIAVDMNACNATASYAITEPTALAITGASTHVLCNGGNTGTVNIDVSGGVTPYRYQWSNSAITEDLNAVVAGAYIVTVIDANNCTATSGYVVNEPDSLVLTGYSEDAKCFTSADGEIHLSASGGTQSYQFSIGNQFQSISSFTNVPGGNYQPVVRDANGCTDTIRLVINTPPPIATSITTGSVNCFGGNDGIAIAMATGMNGPFTYQWSNSITNDTARNLSEGTYYVTVTDSNRCLAFDTALISEPPQLELTAVIGNVGCNGENTGYADLSVTGGTPDYSYSWTNNRMTPYIDSLSAGSYTVVVTDNNNCSVSGSYSVIEPSQMNLSAIATPVVCNGDSNGIASVTAYGGTPSYSYQWDGGADNQITSSAVNLPAGSYDVTVTDANSCTATVSPVVTEPVLLVAVIDTYANPLCHGESSGFALASANGGTGAVSYLWNNSPPSNDAEMTGASAGIYTVTATDGNGCTASATVMLNEPPPLTVVIIPADTTVTYGDSVTLRAVHSPAYVSPSYAWEPSSLPLWCIAPCAEPTIVPTEPVWITVSITVQGGNCAATARAFIDLDYNNSIHAPNAFSPDGDGINDEFEIFFTSSLSEITCIIFNRWGEKLFETRTIGEFWDGTDGGEMQNPGVYVYWVEGVFLNGERKQFKGSVTLLR